MSAALKQPSPIELQDRDLALLRGLFESRLMTLDHAAALHFDGKREMTKKRVQKLKAARLIDERPRHASQPSVLYLTGEALSLLYERGQLSEYPKLSRPALLKRAQVSDLTLRHELEVMSVKAAFTSAIRKFGRFRIAEFSTWPHMNQFSVRRSAIDPRETGEIIVKPDAYIRIVEHMPGDHVDEHSFFLEVDRSTESQEKLARKALAYLEFYRSGGFAESLGHPRSEYKKFPFLVLIVCPTAARRDNAIKRMLANDPPTLTQAWLATFEEVTTNPLGLIWIRPRDYRQANEPTHSSVRQEGITLHRHRSAREDHVAQICDRHALFNESAGIRYT